MKLHVHVQVDMSLYLKKLITFSYTLQKLQSNSSGHFLQFDKYQKPVMMIILELVACLHALHIVKTTTILMQVHGTFLNMPNSLDCAFVFFSLDVQIARKLYAKMYRDTPHYKVI